MTSISRLHRTHSLLCVHISKRGNDCNPCQHLNTELQNCAFKRREISDENRKGQPIFLFSFTWSPAGYLKQLLELTNSSHSVPTVSEERRISRKISRTKINVFWDVAPYGLAEIYRRFRVVYCLNHRSISTRLHGAISQKTSSYSPP
jgi:hypothetical protein